MHKQILSFEALSGSVALILAIFSYSLEKWSGSTLGWKITCVLLGLSLFMIFLMFFKGWLYGRQMRKNKEKENTLMLDPNNKKVYGNIHETK